MHPAGLGLPQTVSQKRSTSRLQRQRGGARWQRPVRSPEDMPCCHRHHPASPMASLSRFTTTDVAQQSGNRQEEPWPSLACPPATCPSRHCMWKASGHSTSTAMGPNTLPRNWPRFCCSHCQALEMPWYRWSSACKGRGPGCRLGLGWVRRGDCAGSARKGAFNKLFTAAVECEVCQLFWHGVREGKA